MKKRGRSEAPVTCVVRVGGQTRLFILEMMRTCQGYCRGCLPESQHGNGLSEVIS